MTDRTADENAIAAELYDRTEYPFVYAQARAYIEHVLDRREEWRKLTRDELVDKLMATLRAGLEPVISDAVVKTGAEVLKSLREQEQS